MKIFVIVSLVLAQSLLSNAAALKRVPGGVDLGIGTKVHPVPYGGDGTGPTIRSIPDPDPVDAVPDPVDADPPVDDIPVFDVHFPDTN